MPQIDFLTYVHKIKLRMLSTFVQLCTTVFTMCINSLSIECSCTELVKLFFFLSIRVYVFIYMSCQKLCLLWANIVWFLSSCSERVCLMYRISPSDRVWCPMYNVQDLLNISIQIEKSQYQYSYVQNWSFEWSFFLSVSHFRPIDFIIFS